MQSILCSDNSIIFALFVLLFGSIFSGMLFKDILTGVGYSFFGSSIYIFKNHLVLDYEYLSNDIKNLPLLGTIFGCFFAFFLNIFIFKIFKKSGYYRSESVCWNGCIFSAILYIFFRFKLFFNYK